MFSTDKIRYSLVVTQDASDVEELLCDCEENNIESTKRMINSIKQRISLGDIWAWALVEVSAEYMGFVGKSILGGCFSYKNEEEFIKEGEYQVMKYEALNALIEQLMLGEFALNSLRSQGVVKV